jgi:NitT/TauT family transport system substrate-binding protein
LRPSTCVLAAAAWLTTAFCPAFGQDTRSPARVSVGILSITTEAAIFIADAKGYFRAENLDVSLSTFRSASDMVPQLAIGELDVSAGSPSAGLYNAILRGLKIRIVADKAYSPPGYGPMSLIIRKLATTAPGVVNMATLNTALKSVGLGYDDVDTQDLPFPEHVAALANKAVDGALTAEPFVTIAVERGVAVNFKRDDEIDPGHQLGCLLFSSTFADGRSDAAVRFLRAYLRGARYYNRALSGGKIAGDNADDVIGILAKYISMKDEALLRRITPTGLHPDGRMNIDSLQRDFDFYASRGLVQGRLVIKDIIDETLLNAALKSLSAER